MQVTSPVPGIAQPICGALVALLKSMVEQVVLHRSRESILYRLHRFVNGVDR